MRSTPFPGRIKHPEFIIKICTCCKHRQNQRHLNLIGQRAITIHMVTSLNIGEIITLISVKGGFTIIRTMFKIDFNCSIVRTFKNIDLAVCLASYSCGKLPHYLEVENIFFPVIYCHKIQIKYFLLHLHYMYRSANAMLHPTFLHAIFYTIRLSLQKYTCINGCEF
jgi:hypothetical protein